MCTTLGSLLAVLSHGHLTCKSSTWILGLGLRASPAVLGMWSCIVKLDEENRTFAGLAQEIGFAHHDCAGCCGW